MKRHRFDPFSFLFGALFLTVGGSFLFGSTGATAVRPFRSWPAAVVVVGLVLVAWAVARAVRPGSAAPAPAPADDDAFVTSPDLFDGETAGASAADEHASGDRTDDP
jgi:hypothetical protein